jgi:hypothetical protein
MARQRAARDAAAALLVLCACLVPRAQAKPTELVLVSLDLTKYPDAVCNDGSPGAQRACATKGAACRARARSFALSRLARCPRRAVQPGAVA